MKKNKLKRIDLSKLNINKVNDLTWVIIIENVINRPKENGGDLSIKNMIEFKYYKDKRGNYWLCNCSVPDEFQRQGIGRMMIKRAIKEYGQVYFSNASPLEFNTKFPNNDYDSRYLTESGRKFVNALIRMHDIPTDWLRFPEI